MAVIFKLPERPGRKPIVVVTVQNHGRRGRNARLLMQALRTALSRRACAAASPAVPFASSNRRRPGYGLRSGPWCRRLLPDQSQTRICGVRGQPVRFYEYFRMCVRFVRHVISPFSVLKYCHGHKKSPRSPQRPGASRITQTTLHEPISPAERPWHRHAHHSILLMRRLGVHGLISPE